MTATDDRLAWLEERRQGVGASDVAAILGRSPWASPWSIWADKVGLLPVDSEPDTPSKRLGRDLEPVIARWFYDHTGLEISGEQTMVRLPGTVHFATVDGFVCRPSALAIEDALGTFESKYSADAPWERLPAHYDDQVQWQMHCAGLDRAWLACLHLPFGRPHFAIHEIERDDEHISVISDAVDRFWFDHVVTGDPPPTDGSDATTEALKAVFGEPASDGGAVDLDAELAEVVDWLRQRKADAKRVAEDIAAAENVLREALGTRTEGRIGGRLAVSWRPQSRTTVDLERLRADHGDAYDKVSTTRVLRLHGGNR